MSNLKYKYLNKCSGKTWIIGDVHGYANTLKTLIGKIALEKSDRLILLGDLVDRGPNSKGVFDFIIELRASGYDIECIMGNHDYMMLNAQEEEIGNGKSFLRFLKKDVARKNWFNMGGNTTMKSFGAKRMLDVDTEYYDFIQGMSHYLEDDEYLYVHAGFDFEGSEPFEDIQSMMWIRDFKVSAELTKGKKVVHGHTPVDIDFIKDVIENPDRDHFIALDNGVYLKNLRGKGRLLAFETGSKTLIEQVVQDTDY